MALIAEELVEEWLNRQGYFTIRGIKLGVHEIDLLAICINDGEIKCRHIEVQASLNPVSYLTKLSKESRKNTGRAAGSAKERTHEELRDGVREWVEKKFDLRIKRDLRKRLAGGEWTRELVVGEVKFEEELDFIRAEGVEITPLRKIIAELKTNQADIKGAAGSHLADLITMAK